MHAPLVQRPNREENRSTSPNTSKMMPFSDLKCFFLVFGSKRWTKMANKFSWSFRLLINILNFERERDDFQFNFSIKWVNKSLTCLNVSHPRPHAGVDFILQCITDMIKTGYSEPHLQSWTRGENLPSIWTRTLDPRVFWEDPPATKFKTLWKKMTVFCFFLCISASKQKSTFPVSPPFQTFHQNDCNFFVKMPQHKHFLFLSYWVCVCLWMGQTRERTHCLPNCCQIF